MDISAMTDGNGLQAKGVMYQAELEVKREQEELRQKAWAAKLQQERDKERRMLEEKAARKARMSSMLKKK
jgi:hypothetical protein